MIPVLCRMFAGMVAEFNLIITRFAILNPKPTFCWETFLLQRFPYLFIPYCVHTLHQNCHHDDDDDDDNESDDGDDDDEGDGGNYDENFVSFSLS